VIAGKHQTKESADSQASEIRKQGFSADVYAPYGGNPNYAVVIGAQIPLSAARQLQQEALESGLSKDTSLWTFPQK
jgi:cell division protein FtsN